MPTLSKASREKLASVAEPLQRLVMEAIKETDFMVITGYRGKAEQQLAFATGHSKLDYPHSRHNSLPSEAIDLAPNPVDWQATDRFYALATVIKTVAQRLDIDIVWGGDWPMRDLVHFELRRKH